MVLIHGSSTHRVGHRVGHRVTESCVVGPVSQEVGLSELRAGVASEGLHSILSMMTLMMFHLYITVILGTATRRGVLSYSKETLH